LTLILSGLGGQTLILDYSHLELKNHIGESFRIAASDRGSYELARERSGTCSIPLIEAIQNTRGIGAMVATSPVQLWLGNCSRPSGRVLNPSARNSRVDIDGLHRGEDNLSDFMQETIGRYRITRKLGEGGMGVVFAARDEELDREVAIKLVCETADPDARERLRREGRAIAQVTHPNVCRLFEFGEIDGEPFIVMELLDGESLAARLARGPVCVAEAVDIALEILAALEALHRHGIVHRDLKPSNVFLTGAGVKLLDFGLARTTPPERLDGEATVRMERHLTRSGMIVGTPHYMAPEQVLGRPIEPRSDLFAAGILLFEMISGRRPFNSDVAMSVLHSIVYDQAPVLTGSPAIEAAGRVIQRAMAKRAEDRYQSAAAMADELAPVRDLPSNDAIAVAHATTRLIVLPYRLLRPDPDIDFLSESLAEAITASLAGLESLVVRSSLTGIRMARDGIDLNAIAREAGVDVVIAGTLLRSGDVLRVGTQLLEVPGGTVLWSQTSQVTMGDIFQVQDEVTHRTVNALALPLTEREHRLLNRDVPASPRAYEFYLRATRQGHGPEDWIVARDLYRRAVDEDPAYAPAWARLARAHLLVGKYTVEPGDHHGAAEAAVRHALDLNPDLPMAQNICSQIEVELGRSKDALRRLLAAASRRRSDPEMFAAIVHAARFCGLVDESIAAHDRARQLDPNIPTSVTHSHFMKGDYARALANVGRDIGYIDVLSMVMLGRVDAAMTLLRERERTATDRRYRLWLAHLRATMEGDATTALTMIDELLLTVRDSEALFYLARALARLSANDKAIETLERSVEGGFLCYPAFERDLWLDPLRSNARFKTLVERVGTMHEDARQMYESIPA
jgi:serine/threonine protein kinase